MTLFRTTYIAIVLFLLLPALGRAKEPEVLRKAAQKARAAGKHREAVKLLDQAISSAEDSKQRIRLKEEVAVLYSERGHAHHALKDHARAMKDFKKACALHGRSAEYLNMAAWLAATCPDEKTRDGKYALDTAARAVAAARAAYAQAQKDGAGFLAVHAYVAINSQDTLAAAQAECSDFRAAVRQQLECLKSFDEIKLVLQFQLPLARVMERALKGGMGKEMDAEREARAVLAELESAERGMRARLALYRDRRPYREQ